MPTSSMDCAPSLLRDITPLLQARPAGVPHLGQGDAHGGTRGAGPVPRAALGLVETGAAPHVVRGAAKASVERSWLGGMVTGTIPPDAPGPGVVAVVQSQERFRGSVHFTVRVGELEEFLVVEAEEDFTAELG